MNLPLSKLARHLILALLVGAAMPAQSVEPPPAASVTSPESALTAETLYLMLLGEIAGARGEVDVATEAYMQLLLNNRDARIARRATEIALYARNPEAATQAARIWSELEPESDEARRILAGVLASGANRLDEVQIELARILATHPDQLEANLLGLNRALARLEDKEIVKAIIFRLTEPYLDQPAAHFARAQAAAGMEDDETAMAAIDRAIELAPEWEPGILLKAQLLMQTEGAGSAADALASWLNRHDGSRNVRLTLARTLVSAERLEEARTAFQELLAAAPGDPDMLFAVALVSLQLEDLEQAASMFQRALDAGHPEANGIQLNLGNIAEKRDDTVAALAHYDAVGRGRHYLDAQIRIAMLLARGGQLDEARAHLRATEGDESDRKRLALAEAALLREASRYGDALLMLDAMLQDQPDDADLLYETAMLAERLDRIDLLESRLTRLLELQPDHAHALNALGYTLADRNLRLEEALTLIERALALMPDDPFILDSMGWVQFRRNDLGGALEHLERAYEIQADPEIAAHLGEVLWALERRDEARAVWQEALGKHPDNATLEETIRRLTGEQ